MTNVARQWHHRWWCDCGYNYADETVFRLPRHQPMCPECGRPGIRMVCNKGRWNVDWHGEGSWTWEEWEVWIDPDKPTGIPDITGESWRTWWRDFCELFRFTF